MKSREKEISFRTADGWTIYGSLHLPESTHPEDKAAAALLLHGPDHDREAFASFVYPGMAQILSEQGVAVLRIDSRGRGQSVGEQECHSFSNEQKAHNSLDVKAALEFMASQGEIDGNRLAVFAEEDAAEWALIGAKGNPNVTAYAFLSGRVGPTGREISANHDAPMLCVVSKEDRRGFADMAAVYAGSKNPNSDFRIYENMGKGTTMFAVWRYKYPDKRGVEFLANQQGVDTEKIGLVPRDPGDEKPIENIVCDWIAAQLNSLGRFGEVSFTSDDGWTIYGSLLVPQLLKKGQKAPGIVLLHSGGSDRYIFHNLERVFAKGGVAVLNIDWRGRGKSRGRGNYFKLSREERDAAYLDAKAAVNFLADQPEVDSGRMAILGSYLGAKLAVAAALNDPRIGALVMLSGYIPSGKEREEIAKSQFPMLLIGSRGFGPVTNAITDLWELTRDKASELIIYDGAALGHQLFEMDRGLEGRIVEWVKGRLKGGADRV